MEMSWKTTITLGGIIILLLFSLYQLCLFYNINFGNMQSYIAFYIFLLISKYVLPENTMFDDPEPIKAPIALN